jgi:predicted P-loop ATPase
MIPVSTDNTDDDDETGHGEIVKFPKSAEEPKPADEKARKNNEIIVSPQPSEEHDQADQTNEQVANDERTKRLFAWATTVLEKIGLIGMVKDAKSQFELRNIKLDVDGTEVALAIRDALYPAAGKRQGHFHGFGQGAQGALKRILRNRLDDLKRDQENKLRQRTGATRDWTEDLILNKQGEVIPNVHNLILTFRKAEMWKGVFAYDEFNARVVLRRNPAWGKEKIGAWLTDHHETMARAHLQTQGLNSTGGDVGKAIQAAAKHNVVHPVRGLFESLTWNRVPRLETWLIDYFHAEDTPYIRAIGPRWLIAAVARIYEPGCQVDTFPILEGPQGIFKSKALRGLAIRDEWYSDQLTKITDRDTAYQIAGVLIVEIGEMEALQRVSEAAKKLFLVKRNDSFRPPWGKHRINLPRQCTFAATINPLPGGYLTDATGGRRAWPFECIGEIDLDGLKQARDQLWAEAVHLFEAGHPWWLETPASVELAKVEQDLRFVTDLLEQPIREWLDDREGVTIAEVVQHMFGPSKLKDQKLQNRVQKIITHIGYTHVTRPRLSDGTRPRVYCKQPEIKNH